MKNGKSWPDGQLCYNHPGGGTCEKEAHLFFCIWCLHFAVLLILFITCGYAPFGNKSLAVDDASIQYLDFYAYFKDVLAQKNSIFYTFGKHWEVPISLFSAIIFPPRLCF